MDLKSRRFQESGDGILRRSDTRPLLFFFDVGLARRYAMDRQREPARRYEGLGALIGKTGRHQSLAHHPAQVVGRPRLHARGDFFGQ